MIILLLFVAFPPRIMKSNELIVKDCYFNLKRMQYIINEEKMDCTFSYENEHREYYQFNVCPLGDRYIYRKGEIVCPIHGDLDDIYNKNKLVRSQISEKKRIEFRNQSKEAEIHFKSSCNKRKAVK